METISRTFGQKFHFENGGQQFEVTHWELVDKGIALYNYGTYKGTVLEESSDYEQLRQDLRKNSIKEV